MKSKKVYKLNNTDIAREQRIERQIQTEKIKLDHPKGRERFEKVIKHAKKKSKK